MQFSGVYYQSYIYLSLVCLAISFAVKLNLDSFPKVVNQSKMRKDTYYKRIKSESVVKKSHRKLKRIDDNNGGHFYNQVYIVCIYLYIQNKHFFLQHTYLVSCVYAMWCMRQARAYRACLVDYVQCDVGLKQSWQVYLKSHAVPYRKLKQHSVHFQQHCKLACSLSHSSCFLPDCFYCLE